MELWNSNRMRLVVVGVIAAMVLDGGHAKADFVFGEPTNLGPPVNSSSDEWGPSLSENGLSLFFTAVRPNGYGNRDIWVATRAETGGDWATPMNLGPTINTSSIEGSPDISADGLALYFNSDRSGSRDIWVTTRVTMDDDWGTPVNLGQTVNSTARDTSPSISSDGLELFFYSNRHGQGDLYVTTRATKEDPWGEAVNLGPTVNSSASDGGPSISSDGLTLFFWSARPGGYGGSDLYFSTRETKSDPWADPVNIGPTLNSPSWVSYPTLSPTLFGDGSTVYFGSDLPGGFGKRDLWQVPILPIVDLNGDGIVDSADMCIMVDHWGESYSLCDIGPLPWGDGIVDVQDLIVLAKYLKEPGLIAYWMLDETEGDIAYDSVGGYNGTLVGDPTWQIDAGMIDGALEFDGRDDYVVTDFVLNPADGSFSVFAWIQGGAEGEVILSEVCPMNWDIEWLLADPVTGALATDQKLTLLHKTLTSNVIITDGEWHHVGLSWNGSERKLYVDNIEVARDSQTTLAPGGDALQIGTGSKRTKNSYWSGLIDDVRIYDRALTPQQVADLAQ
jgi:Tol biopolymer transport system component